MDYHALCIDGIIGRHKRHQGLRVIALYMDMQHLAAQPGNSGINKDQGEEFLSKLKKEISDKSEEADKKIKEEIHKQLKDLGLATKEDIASLRREITALKKVIEEKK